MLRVNISSMSSWNRDQLLYILMSSPHNFAEKNQITFADYDMCLWLFIQICNFTWTSHEFANMCLTLCLLDRGRGMEESLQYLQCMGSIYVGVHWCHIDCTQ